MAVFAHPDDEIDVSPLLAKLASEGHQVYLIIATNGNMGFGTMRKYPREIPLLTCGSVKRNVPAKPR